MTRIFTYLSNKEDGIEDVTSELIHAAGMIGENIQLTAILCGKGDSFSRLTKKVSGFFDDVWTIDHDEMAYPNAEIVRSALVDILPSDAIVLFSHEHFAMDLAPGLSIKLDAAYLPDVVDILSVKDGTMKAVRQEYNGMVSAHVSLNMEKGAVVTIRPGVFQGPPLHQKAGNIVDKTSDVTSFSSKRRFLEIIESEVGDVDITKSEVLVSIGRGIEDEDNIEIAEDLAKAMGADLSCSRPIVDAKWMEKSRQVGTSGQTVKPKVYLAMGISGSFQHLGGIKGSPFIVAVNKNPKAPIFQVADVGIVTDILEFIPELTDAIKES